MPLEIFAIYVITHPGQGESEYGIEVLLHMAPPYETKNAQMAPSATHLDSPPVAR
jgi:hypothetical protein